MSTPIAAGLADEGEWLELLVASERAPDLLQTIQTGTPSRRLSALRSLLKDVQSREAYAEEAQRAGAVRVLTKLIAESGNEETLSLAAQIIASCGGSVSNGGKSRKWQYGAHEVWIKEGALGDGLGARVWIAAHILCRLLTARPEIVKDQEVLELGSGCGLCGILAAKLGAKQVTLTDYEANVLENLQACCAGNIAPHSQTPSSVANRTQEHQWDLENMLVRRLDWAEASPSNSRREHQIVVDSRTEDLLTQPPSVSKDKKFARIIGSDLLYEVVHGELVAAVLADRLASGGQAFIALAVRRKEHIERLVECARGHGLQVSVEQENIDADAVGIVGREHEYEGGFVTVYASR